VDHLTLKHLMIAVAVYAVCLAVLPVLTALVAATIVLGLWLARSRAKPEDREGFLLRMLPLIPLSFPPALLATWLAACVALGHPPRKADYHMEIHPIVTELALLCTLIWLIVNLWFLGAMGWLVGVAITWLTGNFVARQYRWPIMMVLIGFAVLFATKYAAETLASPGWFQATMSLRRPPTPIVIRSVPM
jgi:hypothetical protein